MKERMDMMLSKTILSWRGRWNRFMEREVEGVGVVEVILILVVLIGLVIIFKSQLTTIVNNIFKTISDQSSGI